MLYFRCILDIFAIFSSAIFYFCKLIRVLSKNISKPLFAKRFCFSVVFKIIFYTQLVFVYHAQEDFYIVHDHSLSFYLTRFLCFCSKNVSFGRNLKIYFYLNQVIFFSGKFSTCPKLSKKRGKTFNLPLQRKRANRKVGCDF